MNPVDRPSLESNRPEKETRGSKKRRLNRPVSACETCRKLKTRCESVPGKNACRRCVSLGISCDLPGIDNEPRFEDTASINDVDARLASIEQRLECVQTQISIIPEAMNSRLAHLERSVDELAQSDPWGFPRFIKHYGFWISVNNTHDLPDDFEQNHPLLFSTACLLASRFVPSISKATGHKIYLMVRRLAASVVLKPPPLSHEELQGLLLLSMFSPTIQTTMPIDSWLMSALGINHATLHLNHPANMTLPANSGDMLLPKLRIWNALCLTHIQEVFSIGNGRQSMVHQKFVDYCYDILDTPKSSFEDARLSAEVLLYWKTAHLLGHSQRMEASESLIFDELVQWKLSWGQVFDNPLSVSLRFSYMFCYLLLYRVSLRAQTSSPILKGAALKVSREILEMFQELDFAVILDLPDYYFFITIYAALTLCKFTIRDPLIAATQETLTDLAPNDEHIAFRFGTVLQEIRQKAAAAGTSLMDQTSREIEIEGLTSNEHYAWDVFMAAYYPQHTGTPGRGLESTAFSDETAV